MNEEKKYSKLINIIINGKDFELRKEKITFEEVIKLGLGSYSPNPDTAYTVSYSKGHLESLKGQLFPGKSVMIKNGMIFNATRTTKS